MFNTKEEMLEFIIPLFDDCKSNPDRVVTPGEVESLTRCFNALYDEKAYESLLALFDTCTRIRNILMSVTTSKVEGLKSVREIMLELTTNFNQEVADILHTPIEDRITNPSEVNFVTTLRSW